MKNLSFYEQAGIVVPGAVLLFGLFLIQPDLHDILAKDGITIGALGIFILLAYATGHLVAALGNVLEKVLWWPFGGMPSNWVTDPKRSLLNEAQTALWKLAFVRDCNWVRSQRVVWAEARGIRFFNNFTVMCSPIILGVPRHSTATTASIGA